MSVLNANFKFRIKRAARALGLLNWVNHIEYLYGNPIDTQALEFFRQFIPDGSLCFDVGAHYGRKTMLFRKLGASVVAIEPIAACARALQKSFGSDSRVFIVNAACGKEIGCGTLRYCPISPQNSSLSADLEGNLPETDWEEQEGITITTLDSLIAEYGVPEFCKIDAEGFELPILQGLNHRIPALSFEFHCSHLEQTESCLQKLTALGYTAFNFTHGSALRLVRNDWSSAANISNVLQMLPRDSAGDLYALAKNTTGQL